MFLPQPSSSHVQSVATGYSRERCFQRHADGQQAASPSAAGSDTERPFATVAPGSAAAGGSAATPTFPGETLQGTQDYTHTHTPAYSTVCKGLGDVLTVSRIQMLSKGTDLPRPPPTHPEETEEELTETSDMQEDDGGAAPHRCHSLRLTGRLGFTCVLYVTMCSIF